MPEIDEGTLFWLRLQPDAVDQMTYLLRVHEMGPAESIRTKHEVRDYVQSGDDGAARALIQHAKGRRESWRRATKGG